MTAETPRPAVAGELSVETVVAELRGHIGFDKPANLWEQHLLHWAEEAAALILRLTGERDEARDKIDGLESDLHSAVMVAFHRGALTWTKDNYPDIYAQLMATFETQADRTVVHKESGE